MITTLKILDASYQARIGKTQIDFKPGINLLVGENGSGKSSLLELIRLTLADETGQKARLIRDVSVPVEFYSAEEATTIHHKSETGKLSDMAISHGQRLQRYLDSLQTIQSETVIIADEIETALSFDVIWNLGAFLHKANPNVQWIIATHNPILWTLKSANIINLSRDDNTDYVTNRLRKLAKRIG